MGWITEQSPEVYDRIGRGYEATRRSEPRITAQLAAALAGCQRVVNVGAGTGSYEEAAPIVVAVEPSATMIMQRPPGAAPALRAAAEALPFPDAAFDAALAVLTVHHWSDWRAGVRELARVASTRVVILTHMAAGERFWLLDYFPEIPERDRGRMPTMAQFLEVLPGARCEAVPVPRDCVDGFLCAWWARPAAYLDPLVRAGISAFDGLGDVQRRLERLEGDLASGVWAARHEALLERDAVDYGYRLVIADRAR